MTDSPTFRKIGYSDIEAIFDVRVATWHNDRGAEELTELGITQSAVHELMAKSHFGWLCEIDSRVVGFAMGDKTNGEMWVIAVLKEHEAEGIGKRLLRLVEKQLFSNGWKEIWLTTDPDETVRAVGFYRHLGWVDWKMVPGGDRFMRRFASSQLGRSDYVGPEQTTQTG